MLKLVFSASIKTNASRSYPMLPYAKKMDAFFRNARSSFKSAFSSRNRTSSARSDSVTAVPPGSCRALNAATRRPSEASLMPSYRATVATARPMLMTSFTASSLYPGVNSRRVLAMMNILSCEVSTQRGQGQLCWKNRW